MTERDFSNLGNLTNQASYSFEQHRRSKKTGLIKFAFPAAALVLAVAAAACGGESNPDQESNEASFSDNLSGVLFDACRIYVNNYGTYGEGDRKGYELANEYLEANPTDSRALYLMSIGAFFQGNYEEALPALIVASSREDLPPKQANLAADMAQGILDASKTDDIIERLNLIFEPEYLPNWKG